jgi:uncharacterized protein with GYD domain
MPMYIVLGKFTDQGIRDIRNLRQRVQENMKHGEQLGLKPHGWYLTMGRYDFVVVAEAPDDQTIATQVLGVASRGVSRPETLRAFTLDEADAIIQKMG